MQDPNARRDFLRAAVGAGAAAALGLKAGPAFAAGIERWIAEPPAGFEPLSIPGRVVKVQKGTDFPSLMQGNLLWPKADVSRLMLERALMEFTGARNLVAALSRFIHKEDIVAVKVNGIAGQQGQTVAVNFELILPLVEGLIGVGVKPQNITVFEQHASYLRGTRLTLPGYDLPLGVKVGFHSNHDAVMPSVSIFQGTQTKFVRYLTQASAVIDLTMMKDHSLCGFTGALKNMSHGQIINPHHYHAHGCNPQIGMINNHPVLKSRVRLHITDAFKVIYDGGPTDKKPERRLGHGAVYVATDPVALDTIGWRVIDEARIANGLKTLKDVGREPAYIRLAADIGLGVHAEHGIRFTTTSI